MQKSWKRALFSAVLLGWSGLANAESYENPSCTDGATVCDGGGLCAECCECECLGNWLDNTVVWAGGDVYKSVGDRAIAVNRSLNGNFGLVTGFNTGFAIGDSKVRGQFGASYGAYDLKGRLAVVPQANELEEQSFVTAGAYKRGDMLNDCDRISWGVVYDNFAANQWGVYANTVFLGQIRGVAGYALDECTEVGMWGTFRLYDDSALLTGIVAPPPESRIRAMNQANVYLKRNFEFGGVVTAYVGVFDNADIGDWQFGLLGQTPLSDNMSLYGNFTYVVPGADAGSSGAAEEQFNVSVGLAYYFGGKAVSPTVTGQQGLPLLNVANNGSFLITD